MDWDVYFRSVLAFGFVLGLIAVATWAVKRFGIAGIRPQLNRKRRLTMLESLPLDARHRLVLVRRDNVEHLLLIGGGGDVMIETIAPTKVATDNEDQPA